MKKKKEPLSMTSRTKDSIGFTWSQVEMVDDPAVVMTLLSSPSAESPWATLFQTSTFHHLSPYPPSPATTTTSSPLKRSRLTGYEITYQASGSNLVERSRFIMPGVTNHVIGHLHESTIYNVCLVAHFKVTSSSTSTSSLSSFFPSTQPFKTSPVTTGAAVAVGTTASATMTSTAATVFCLQASTITESFAMTVGSTLGAFLALGIVISLVYLAKSQKKHLKKFNESRLAASLGRAGEGVPLGLEEAILRMGDNVFLQLYRQKMPRERNVATEGGGGDDEGDKGRNGIDERDGDVIACGDGEESGEVDGDFVLVSLDDALKMVDNGEDLVYTDENGGAFILNVVDNDVDDDDEDERDEGNKMLYYLSGNDGVGNSTLDHNCGVVKTVKVTNENDDHDGGGDDDDDGDRNGCSHGDDRYDFVFHKTSVESI